MSSLSLRPGAATAALLLALLPIGGCGHDPDGFFPLAKGWQWVYRINMTTTEGASTKKYVVANVGHVALGNEIVSARRSIDGAVHYYREHPGGVLRIGEAHPGAATHLYRTPRVVVPNPPVEGAAWIDRQHTVALEHRGPPEESLNRITVALTMNYIIEGTADEVIVPAGRFTHCLRVRGTGIAHQNVGFYVGQTTIRVESTEWMAPGIGLIKVERKETTTSPTLPAGEYRMELEELRRG